MHEMTMGEPVTQGQFFERMNQSDEKHLEAHRRLRESLDQTRTALEEKLDQHAKDDAEVADRVSRIEEREKSRDKETVRRSTWISLLVGLPSAIAALYALLHSAK